MRGGGLNWYFGEQGLPVGIQECHRGCVDYLSLQFDADGAYTIAVGGTCRRGRLPLCGLDVRRWTPWGIKR